MKQARAQAREQAVDEADGDAGEDAEGEGSDEQAQGAGLHESEEEAFNEWMSERERTLARLSRTDKPVLTEVRLGIAPLTHRSPLPFLFSVPSSPIICRLSVKSSEF